MYASVTMFVSPIFGSDSGIVFRQAKIQWLRRISKIKVLPPKIQFAEKPAYTTIKDWDKAYIATLFTVEQFQIAGHG